MVISLNRYLGVKFGEKKLIYISKPLVLNPLTPYQFIISSGYWKDVVLFELVNII